MNTTETSLTESISKEIISTTVDLGIEYSELRLDEFAIGASLLQSG